jgi:hypothetical protein
MRTNIEIDDRLMRQGDALQRCPDQESRRGDCLAVTG